MKKLLASMLLSCAMVVPALAADQYTIDPDHTYPMFEVSHMGFSTQRGRFNKTSGKIVLDRAAKQGSIDLLIDVTSLDMGFPLWDEQMASEDFFNTESYPTMTFRSAKLIFEGDQLVGAEGFLTLLGVSKPVHLTVSNFKCGAHPFFKKEMCGAEISTTIKRSDFGMTRFLSMVGDEIKIHSPVEAFKD